MQFKTLSYDVEVAPEQSVFGDILDASASGEARSGFWE